MSAFPFSSGIAVRSLAIEGRMGLFGQANSAAHPASFRGEGSSRVSCRIFVLLVLLVVVLSFLLVIFGVQRRVTPPQRPHSVEHGISTISYRFRDCYPVQSSPAF